MVPQLIALSPAFLQLLEVDKTTAYALKPCFATRLEVYSVSARSDRASDAWISCALLVTQEGQLFLFDVNDGCIINTVLLGRPVVDVGTHADRVEIVVQANANPDDGTQSMYICCHRPQLPTHSCEATEGGNSTARLEKKGRDNADDIRHRSYPPFSYVMRFHCRNAPIALQLIRIIMMFVKQEDGGLSVRHTGVQLGSELRDVPIADPLAFLSPGRKQDSQQGEAGSIMSSPFKRLLTSPHRRNLLRMKDIAISEKNRLAKICEPIEIPPLVESISQLQPVSMPLLADKKLETGDAGGSSSTSCGSQRHNVENDHSTKMSHEVKALPMSINTQTSTSALLSTQFCEQMTRQMPHFSLDVSQDILLANKMPGFEAQCAVFLVQQKNVDLIERIVDRLLKSFSDISMLPQERLFAREAVRAKIRFLFGTTYQKLCDTTRARIECISLDQLAIDRDRAMMQQAHNAALQSLLTESETKRQKMVEAEANVFFCSEHQLKALKTGLPLSPLSAEEMNWREEVAQAASTLQTIERDVRQVFCVLEKGREDEDEVGEARQQEQQKSTLASLAGGSTKKGKRGFSSVEEEAVYLLRQIQNYQQMVARLEQEKGNDNSMKGVRGVDEDDGGLEKMRLHYNAIVLEQQEQINSLKRDLQQSAASFGVSARWMEQQIHRRGVAEEVLAHASPI